MVTRLINWANTILLVGRDAEFGQVDGDFGQDGLLSHRDVELGAAKREILSSKSDQ